MKEGSKGDHGPFHIQILKNFTYQMDYKPIFTESRISPVNQKGLRTETQPSWILIRILFDYCSFYLLLLSLQCWWADLKGR